MPYFEVFIPARNAEGMTTTLTVDAPNWLEALRSGLANLGEDSDSVANVMCDVQSDNSIHVTDANTNRVFRLREVPKPATLPEQPAAQSVTSERFKTAPQPITRTEAKPAASDPTFAPAADKVDVDEVIADIFERTMELYTERLNPDRIVNDLLDLALEKIPADAGSFYVADISSHDLQFAAVRGPKATEIMASGIRVPIGEGLVGFCALDGLSLVIGDAQRDPRFAREIGEKIGYDPHSMICVSLEKDGRCYGALQLINKQGGTKFTQADLNILGAVGHQAVDLLAQIQT